MEELSRKLDLLIEKLVHNHDVFLGSTPREGLQLDNSSSRPYKGEYNEQGRPQRSSHHAKYEFPYFDGVDPCSWLRKEERKGQLMSIWRNLKTLSMGIDQKSYYPEELFLEFSVEWLKEEIRHTVKMLNPFSLSQVVDKARHQENLLIALSKTEKGQWNKATTSNYQQNIRGIRLSMGNAGNRLFETRRAQGLYYKCGEKYHQGNQCQQNLNAISVTTEEQEVEPIGEIKGDNMNYDVKPTEEPMDEAICLNVL
ncbi:hypothetical protein A4A49_04331 [Nicotiana attenuata]|uniref:Uncharacterized protein n=1 Tax=Nicotiana attenuata TaxID=49451 RepID=A0A1J6IFE0_NICAT|nr:hypothetical protein A4A49_04331 [Nicotiana attenuata]